jgi:hypothetical protein
MGPENSPRIEKGCSIPPGTGNETTRYVRDDIPPIPRHVLDDMRTPPLEQHGPENKMQRNFAESGRRIVPSQSEPPMQQKQRRKRTRDKQRIIKPGVKKDLVKMRL